MSKQNGGTTTDQKSATERIEEARRLYETIGETLSTVLELVKAGDFKDIDLMPKQMTRLTDAIAEVRKKEAEFNDRHGIQRPCKRRMGSGKLSLKSRKCQKPMAKGL